MNELKSNEPFAIDLASSIFLFKVSHSDAIISMRFSIENLLLLISNIHFHGVFHGSNVFAIPQMILDNTKYGCVVE